MSNVTETVARKLVYDYFTWDFYRVELLVNSKDYESLIGYLTENDIEYVEDVAFGSSIIIFRILRSDKVVYREPIFAMFGENPYFSMEGNVTLSESALYRLWNQIKNKD